MARRGPLARLYDSVIAVGKGIFSSKALATPRRSGESEMAHLVGPWGGSGYGYQPINKTEQVLHFREWNYRCIDYICARVSKESPTAVLTVPPNEVKAYKLDEKAYLSGKGMRPHPRSFAPRWWKQKSIGPAKAHEEYEYLDQDDRLVQLLNNPNDPETGVSLWYEAELFNCLTGEDFIWMVTDDAGRISELWVIPSNWVRPICLGKDKLVDWFEVSPRGSTSGIVRFDPAEIIWNKMPSPLSKIYAASPLQAMANTVDSYEKTVAARNYGLDNGVFVNGVLQSPPAAAPLDDTQINRLESRFLSKYAGMSNFGRPLVLEGGLQWVPPPGEHELAFMSSVDMARKWIMGQWGLDEVVLGFGGVSNRASAIAAIANVGMSTIDPRKRRRAAVLTEKLAKRFDEHARIFYEDDTPIDPDSQRADYQIGGTLNAVAPNDYRTHVLQLEPWDEEIYDRPLVTGQLLNPGDTPPPPGMGVDGMSPTSPFDNAGGDADLSPSLKGWNAAAGDAREALVLAYADALIEAKEHDEGNASEVAEYLAYLLEHPEELDATSEKRWAPDKHPRDDNGRFISKDKIQAAKHDPKKAEELRARVTNPEQRAKLDAAIGGDSDVGQTKRGQAKQEAEQRRTERTQRLAKVRDIAQDISASRRGGAPVTAEHFTELASHLPHLSVHELRRVRQHLAASWGHESPAAGKKREEMVEALTRHAKNEVAKLNTEERYADADPLDFSLDSMLGAGDYNIHGPHGNPNPPEQHGGRMGQRHRLMSSLPAGPKTSHGTPDTGSPLKRPLYERNGKH